MVKATYNNRGILLSHVWFMKAEEISQLNKLKADVVFIHGSNLKETELEDAVVVSNQKTLIKDLTPSEDEIFASFQKYLRHHIRQSTRDDDISMKIYSSQEALDNGEIFDTCASLYQQMFVDKGMNVSFNRKLAEIYCRNDALIIGMAFWNETPIGFTAVIKDNCNARAWVGAFDFRNAGENANKYGRAHKRLEWELMKACKDMGITQYDMGGVASFDDSNGIANFKLKYEKNNKIEYTNYLFPLSIKGKIGIKVWKIIKKRGTK